MRITVTLLAASIAIFSTIQPSEACSRRLGCNPPTPKSPVEQPSTIPSRPTSPAGTINNSKVTPGAFEPNLNIRIDPNKVRQNAGQNNIQANVKAQSNRVDGLIPGATSNTINSSQLDGIAASGTNAKKLIDQAKKSGDHASAAKLGAAAKRSDEIISSASTATKRGKSLKPADFPGIGTKISDQKQARHLGGTLENTQNGGGYLKNKSDAQKILDDFHSGKGKIIGKHHQGGPIVRNETVTGYDNNVSRKRRDAPTHNFWIKGEKSVSIVPLNPNLNGG